MIAIVGGGPSGMMAAYSAKKHFPKHRVVLFERNDHLGKKLSLTGGGRCNVTACVSNDEIVKSIVKNGRFMYSSLSHFGSQDIIAFFEDRGLALKQEDHQRMFPITDKSTDIIRVLAESLRDIGVEVRLGSFVEAITPQHLTVNGVLIPIEHLILATGGRTLPQTGSDGCGYGYAQALGHEVTELLPQEVPLVSNDAFIQAKTLQGMSFKDVRLKIKDGKRVVAVLTHDLVITHFGFSGPLALRASFYVQKLMKKGPVSLEFDFIPDYDSLPEQHVNMQKKLLALIGDDVLMGLKHFKASAYDTRGFSYAFVTNGGVNIKEIDPKTMKSKLQSWVSFCGELMDVSAFTGGYNITAALSSGYTAGRYCLDKA